MVVSKAVSDVAGDRAARASATATLLDNPILNALLTEHRSFAISDGPARRYPAAIGPLAGAPDQSRASYDALWNLAGPGGILGLFLPDPPALPTGWSLFRGGMLTQMVCWTPQPILTVKLPGGETLRRLNAGDVPAMLELAKLTEPGPFRQRTSELGEFFGIFEGPLLLAMAGQRMRVPEFVEVSAVCTHPEVRGRGYAGIVMSEVIKKIMDEGKTPFLHAFADNPAVRLYQRLGFAHERSFHLAAIRRKDAGGTPEPLVG